MKKFLIFGDSVMKGVMYDEETGRYSLAKDEKSELFSRSGIYFDNYSKMGATVEKGISTVRKFIDDIDGDTTVLLEYGGNDCDYHWNEIAENPEGEFSPNVDPERFAELYGEMIDLISSRGAKVIVSTLFPLVPDIYFKWISLGKNGANILKWLGDIDILYRWQDYYNALVVSVARRHGCRVFDLRNSIGVCHSFADLVCADGIHPTDKGHSMIAGMLYRYMFPRTAAPISFDSQPVLCNA